MRVGRKWENMGWTPSTSFFFHQFQGGKWGEGYFLVLYMEGWAMVIVSGLKKELVTANTYFVPKLSQTFKAKGKNQYYIQSNFKKANDWELIFHSSLREEKKPIDSLNTGHSWNNNLSVNASLTLIFLSKSTIDISIKKW